MNYRITLKCLNEKDGEKFDRELHMNNYEAALATFSSLMQAAFKDLIDGYELELRNRDSIMYRFTKS